MTYEHMRGHYPPTLNLAAQVLEHAWAKFNRLWRAIDDLQRAGAMGSRDQGAGAVSAS